MKRYADLHVHLYGCPTPEEIWQWALTHPLDEARMNWYTAEYQQVTGVRPDWRSYFSDEDGLERLRHDYLLDSPGPFPHFQARINLPIAVCPLTPDDPGILRTVLTRHRADPRLCHIEYRVLMPHYFEEAALRRYLETMTSYCLENSADGFAARLALSVARPNVICSRMVDILLRWLKDEPELGGIISGLDFCGSEVDHPPLEKRDLFRRVAQESQLQILYHVGETLAGLTPTSMFRWIDQAAALGVHRLGHATVVGLSPDRFEDLDISESPAEADATKTWQRDLGLTKAPIAEIQNTVLARLVEQRAVIETCPTSNRLIAELGSLAEHPARRFLNSGISVIMGSDDPGIFATDLPSEFERMGEAGALTTDQLEQVRLEALRLTDQC